MYSVILYKEIINYLNTLLLLNKGFFLTRFTQNLTGLNTITRIMRVLVIKIKICMELKLKLVKEMYTRDFTDRSFLSYDFYTILKFLCFCIINKCNIQAQKFCKPSTKSKKYAICGSMKYRFTVI